jgi:DNA-binding NarL/FixJ family response regulator
MKAGAMGFVSKKAGYEELIQAIKVVYSGKKYICAETSRKLKNINKFLAGIEDTLRGEDEFFSKREREVLELMANYSGELVHYRKDCGVASQEHDSEGKGKKHS